MSVLVIIRIEPEYRPLPRIDERPIDGRQRAELDDLGPG